MIPFGEFRRPRRRFIASGLSLLGFGLSLGSVGLIGGCDDGKSKMTQIEETEKPTDKAKDSMNFYRNEKTKKPGTKK